MKTSERIQIYNRLEEFANWAADTCPQRIPEFRNQVQAELGNDPNNNDVIDILNKVFDLADALADYKKSVAS